MLIEFTVSNFRSIRDQQSLSLIASSLKEHERTNVFNPGAPGVDRLLKSAVIYGANAAGKSNLLRALDVMQDVVIFSAKESQSGDELPASPFAFDGNAEGPTRFEVVFVVDKVRFQYGFTISTERVLQEWLYAYPEKRPQRWFMRQWSAEDDSYVYDFSSLFLGAKNTWRQATRPNALFLSTAVQLNAEQLSPVFDWFQKTLRVALGTSGFSKSASVKLMKLPGGADKIVSFLKSADVGICGINIQDQAISSEIDQAISGFPDHVRDEMRRNIQTAVQTRHVKSDGSEIWWDLKEESHGTQRLFGFAGPIYDVLENGRILVVDEINNSLHPLLVQRLIEIFHSSETNPNFAQLIFVTHATSILDTDIFRRDQIWFAEKDECLATSIYPLTDFKPRKESALGRGYLQGRYGAIPFLSAGGLL